MQTKRPGAFINCPFTNDYKDKLEAVLFCTLYAGYEPILTLRDGDNSKNRLNKLIEMIGDAKVSIHDLSLCKCTCSDGVGKTVEYYRMNMPFELGLALFDSVASEGRKGGKRKPMLVLEEERYELQKALSDASNTDPIPYFGDINELIKALCQWFDKLGNSDMRGHDLIATEFYSFRGDLMMQAVTEGRSRIAAKKYLQTISTDGWIKEAAVWLQERRAGN